MIGGCAAGRPQGGQPMSEPESEDAGNDPIAQAGDRAGAIARRLGRFTAYVILRFREERCLRMAASLSYTSLLAIVPLTAIAFAMLAAFPVFEGMREQFQTALFANLLPDSAQAMRAYFDQFVRNTATLSAVGIVGLALTAVLLLGTIESSLNAIFQVTRPRAMVPRLMAFWALITLGPLLLGASFSLSTYLFAATEWLGLDVLSGPLGRTARLMPTAIIMVLLVFFYVVIPNRAVSFKGAAVGAVVAGVLFSMLRGVFGYYVVHFPTYQTIYGAVSVFPIFLVWMYLSWTVVLLGAVIAAAMGEWRLAGGRPGAGASTAEARLNAAIAVLAALLKTSRQGGALSQTRLVRLSGLSEQAAERILGELRAAKFVERTADKAWLLARDLKTATLFSLIDGLGLGVDEALARDLPSAPRIGGYLADARRRTRDALDVSLSDLIDERPAKAGKGSGKPDLRPVS
jgi:membrane protein